MACSLSMLLIFLHVLRITMQEPASDQALPQIPPHITGCFSADMATFHCRWNVGTFRTLSEPGNLRLFYINKKLANASSKELSECPHYSTDRVNECFFSENYTTIWTYYSVQLYSQDANTLYDEYFFNVEEIVRPDPPVALNWTLLNVGMTASHFDILVNWEPPESADVQTGWMRLEYEIQHRELNSTLWKVVDLEKGTQRSIYGLQTNIDHEIRVRCKTPSSKFFGEFSDSIIVHVPSKESHFPVAILLIFAALCLVGLLMLVIVSQQQRLMVILLPPVPGPKIRGIDPELLEKGKLAELTSILGGHSDLRPELYNNDPWVEFIELDMEEPCDRLTDMDTDCLMDRSPSSDCPPLSIGYRDDDSGRASCYDPDLPCDPEASPFHPVLSNPTPSQEMSGPAAFKPGSPVPTQTLASEGSNWMGTGRGDLYAQVNDVSPFGEVFLAPEMQSKLEQGAGEDPAVKAKLEKEKEKVNKDCKVKVEDANGGGYAAEMDAGKRNSMLSPDEISDPQQREDTRFVPCQAFGEYQRPSEMQTTSSVPPPPMYTVVEGVGGQNSLLLTPTLPPTPKFITAKPMPTPDGYLTPELLENITP